MKREYEHETFAEKFWDWWDNADLGELVIGTVLILFELFIIAGIAVLITLIVGGFRSADDLPPAEPAEGVAWIMPESGEAAVWLSGVCADEADTARLFEEYTEGDAPVPEWWRPDEPMSAVWEEPNSAAYGSNTAQTVENEPLEPRMTTTDAEPHPPVGIDPGGVDWNVCSTVWGWDGHGAELWELDLFARVFYLEFWGTSLPCSEAGCDAILNLWASGKYGRTLFEALSYYDPQYGYTYRVYPRVWETDYNADGLAWCKEFCTERFINGPQWSAVYFQLGGYHDTDWVPPLYEMDGVYFSGASEVQ